ncbi:DUF5672 family protein [Candidatus Albibeggiatoa sp. nov. BB20]|uniref:DUF5672 family protein n=1 Tax=Candidatus Albibeggiatoa sp. nov. BB20 TaxID=3162723 RepID=UPI0033656CA4
MPSSLASLVHDKKLYLTQLCIKNLDARKYNTLLLSKRFWNNLIGRNKILIFQTDALLCENPVFKLNDFIHYDYIGSKWMRCRPIGIIIDGGLSLRYWQNPMTVLLYFLEHGGQAVNMAISY